MLHHESARDRVDRHPTCWALVAIAAVALARASLAGEVAEFSAVAGEGSGRNGAISESVFAATSRLIPADLDPAGGGGPSLLELDSRLTLREALALALRNNLEIAEARIAPRLAAEGSSEAAGSFSPRLAVGYRLGDSETPVASTFQRTDQIRSNEADYDAGIEGRLPFGLRYESRYDLSSSESDSSQSSLDRAFRGRWRTSITLPLMRDLGWNEASVTLSAAESEEARSRDGFVATLSDIARRVESQYWELSAARASRVVAERSLESARAVLAQARAQVETGVRGTVAIREGEAGVAEMRVRLIQAESRAAVAQDRLLTSVLAASPQVLSERTVVTDPLPVSNVSFDLKQAISRALRNRPELRAARRSVDHHREMIAFAKNQAKPRFDIVASYDAAGLSGSSKRVRDTFVGQQTIARAASEQRGLTSEELSFLDSPAAREVEGDSRKTFSGFLRSSGAHSYSIGARLEVPLGGDAAGPRVRARELELRRARLELRRTIQRVISEVRIAARRMVASRVAVEAADERRQATAELVDGARFRLTLGDAAPFDVLLVERDAADAEAEYVAAALELRLSRVEFEHAQGVLLRSRGVVAEDELSSAR